MDDGDPIFRLLQMADRTADQSSRIQNPHALALGAIASARRRHRKRRRLAGAVVVVAIIGVALTHVHLRAFRPAPDSAAPLAALRAEVTELTARSDRLVSEIAARSADRPEAASKAPDGEVPRTAEMRERAAFALVFLADRTAAAGGNADAAAAYRLAAQTFPDARSGLTARRRLLQH